MNGKTAAPEPTEWGDVRVMVVDDVYGHRLLCSLEVDATPGMCMVGEASNGARGAELAEHLQPDVVVLDLRMPLLDGFEALPLLRRLVPSAHVIVWSSLVDEHDRERALELGASEMLTKQAGGAELVAAIQRVTRRESVTHKLLHVGRPGVVHVRMRTRPSTASSTTTLARTR